ncbi:MAG: glycosyltransferase family 39 protein [bacterium]|nr:MAG: glycosyltransferase family 39 protein [bacterium]
MPKVPPTSCRLFPERTERIVVLLLVAAALVIRLVLLDSVDVIETDGSYYGNIAGAVQRGEYRQLFNPAWPPLYPAVTGVVARVTGDLERAGGLVSVFCGALVVGLVYLLGRAVGGGNVGLLGALFTAFHPRLILYSELYLTESLYVLLFIAVLCLVSMALRRGNIVYLFCTGTALALLYLTRPEGMVTGAAVMLFLCMPFGWRRLTWRSLRAVLLLPLGAAILVVPFSAGLKMQTGYLALTEKGRYNFFVTHRHEYRRAGIDVRTGWMNRIPPTPPASGNGVGEYADGPNGDPKRQGHQTDYSIRELMRMRWPAVLKHFCRTFLVNLLDKLPGAHYHLLFILAVLGLALPRRRAGEEWLWVMVIISTLCALSFYFPLRRFFIGLLPLLNIWAAFCITGLLMRLFGHPPGETGEDRLSPGAGRRRALIALLILVPVLATWYSAVSIRSREYPVEYRRAGIWLRDSYAGRIVIASRKPEISFYAGGEFVPLPHMDPDTVGMWMDREGVTHLFLDEYLIPRTHPEFVPLLEERMVPPSLVVVYRDGPAGRRAVILARRPQPEVR